MSAQNTKDIKDIHVLNGLDWYPLPFAKTSYSRNRLIYQSNGCASLK